MTGWGPYPPEFPSPPALIQTFPPKRPRIVGADEVSLFIRDRQQQFPCPHEIILHFMHTQLQMQQSLQQSQQSQQQFQQTMLAMLKEQQQFWQQDEEESAEDVEVDAAGEDEAPQTKDVDVAHKGKGPKGRGKRKSAPKSTRLKRPGSK